MLLSLMLEVSVRFGMETPRESATNKHVQSQRQKKYSDPPRYPIVPCTKFHARALDPVLVPLNELLFWFGMNSPRNLATNKLL